MLSVRSAHFHPTVHLIVASFEPGEGRRWCCEDEVLA